VWDYVSSLNIPDLVDKLPHVASNAVSEIHISVTAFSSMYLTTMTVGVLFWSSLANRIWSLFGE